MAGRVDEPAGGAAVMPAWWIIFVNFNTAGRCVHQIERLGDDPRYGVFFVDNASRDDDFAVLQASVRQRKGAITSTDDPHNRALTQRALEAGCRLMLLRSPSNLGYSAGNNVALDALSGIVQSGGRYLIVNPDVDITPADAIALFCHDAEIVGPAIFEDYLQAVRPVELRYDFSTGACAAGSAEGRNAPIGVLLSGCCLRLSHEALMKYGMLPEENFLYDEEIKYFERVLHNGGRPAYAKEVVVRHHGSLSLGKKGFEYFYYIFRNRLLYFLRVARPRYGNSARFLSGYVSWFFSVVLSNARRGNWKGIGAQATGVWDAIRGRDGPHRAPPILRRLRS